MGPPKKSGATNRKIQTRKLEDNDKLSKQMKLLLSKSLEDNTSRTELSNDLPLINSLGSRINSQDQEDHVDFSINVGNDLSKQTSTNKDNVSVVSDFINSIPSTSSDNNLENIVQKPLHFNDPSSWPFINDKIRTLLIEHGPKQGKNSDFSYSENFEQRKFSADWFFKTLPNGDKIERNWLMYSDVTKSIYCFPCMLFPSQKMSKAFITDPKTGFNDWRKLNPRIPDHENTFDHKSNVFTWKSFEKRLREGKTIDKELQKEILNEKERWKQILKIILDCVRFCCVNNLALRGSSNDITKSNCGIFLNLIELISSYNPIIAQHLSNSNRRTTYLSNKVQNEFICLLGNSVREKIISNIKEAKYYSIIFDSTPDISHKEQMTQIVRYVVESNDKYTIEKVLSIL